MKGRHKCKWTNNTNELITSTNPHANTWHRVWLNKRRPRQHFNDDHIKWINNQNDPPKFWRQRIDTVRHWFNSTFLSLNIAFLSYIFQTFYERLNYLTIVYWLIQTSFLIFVVFIIVFQLLCHTTFLFWD